ncbi:MAG: DUF4215 domain-containing protein [Nannocystis sp.]|nr:DUF4215 domain-containing protein [Nannocystis sp.]
MWLVSAATGMKRRMGLLAGLLLPACSDDGTNESFIQVSQGSTIDPSSGSGATLELPTTSTTDVDPTTGSVTRCGDGIVDPDEGCDDGNVDNTDYCLGSCELAICGDSYVFAGQEACDDGNASDDDSCIAGCYLASCGDGNLYAGVEQCDDGNKSAGDGCDPGCQLEVDNIVCGDGEVEGDELCDDGNLDNTDSCLDTCMPFSCGDGWHHAVLEQCDDANPDNTDACVNIDGQCLLASCGDGFLHDGVEVCDDGNLDDSDACVGDCKPATCGDGLVQAGVEVCDDGENTGKYEGCGFECAELGPRCGDSLIFAGVELCDDGNEVPGDGCDSLCQLELPPECLGYIALNEPDRALAFNDGPGQITKCDNKAADSWHRFLDPAGVVMPLAPPSIYSCGTDAPGWMQGAYPVKDDGIVARTVCFAWFGDPCGWSVEISVRNCGPYFVFKLPSVPECALRYCGAPL